MIALADNVFQEHSGDLMKRPMSQAGILVIIGIIGLTFVTRNPRFAAFHAVDVLQLLASGACFGVAIALLFGSRGPRTQ